MRIIITLFKSFTSEQVDSLVLRVSLYLGQPSEIYVNHDVNMITLRFQTSMIDYDYIRKIHDCAFYIFDEDVNPIIHFK